MRSTGIKATRPKSPHGNGSHAECANNYLGPPPFKARGRVGPHSAMPVVQLALDENLQDCFVVWCACGFESPAYIERDVAFCVAWEHAWEGEGIASATSARR